MSPSSSPLAVFAAGSLRYVLPELTAAFTAMTGRTFETRHGPAGLLRERIEAGERPDLFLSANHAHPAHLHDRGLADPPVVFARNAMVALARCAVGLSGADFIDQLVGRVAAIGTSTPQKDPSGDYAWEIFRRIDVVRPGSLGVLSGKAKMLVGGSEAAVMPGTYGPVAAALRSGEVDVFLGYRTGMIRLAAEMEDVELVDIPAEIGVSPRYAMTTLTGCQPDALRFALFVVSAPGQAILKRAGFVPVI